MKIALSFPGCHRRGGVERVVWECARFLAAREHEVHVFANEWEPVTHPHLHYRQVPMRQRPAFLSGLSYFHASEKMLQAAEFDAVSTHGCICPRDGVYWAHSVHAAWLVKSREMRGAWSWQGLRQRLNPLHPVLLELERKHFRERRYRKILALTESVKADLMHHYDVPAEDVVVNPNGFSPKEFSSERRLAARASARAQFGFQPEEIVLLFVANELQRKGYPTLLAALRELQRKEVRLLVVGKPDRALVMRMAEEAGVAAQVVAHGPTHDVAALHAASDLFVLPTQYEAFCLAILESLGSGLPVVTSRVPGAQDAVQHGINGRLISDPRDGHELAEALRPLLDLTTLAAYQARVPATVAQYQWPQVLLRYEQILREHAT